MRLLTDVVSTAAGSGRPLDLHDLMYRFTLDSFGQIGFGVDVGCLRTTDKVPFAAAFDSAQVVSAFAGLCWGGGSVLLAFVQTSSMQGVLMRFRASK
jgi:hypothetical protein